MKTLVTITTLLILSFSFYASSQEVRHPFLGSKVSDEFVPVKVGSDALRLDSIQVYEMNSLNDSGLIRKCLYQYDHSGRLTYTEKLIRYFRTDVEAYSNWDTTEFYQYKYNDQDQLIQSLIKVPDEDYLMKTGYIYDGENSIVTEIYTRSFDRVYWDTIGILNIAYNNNKRILSESEVGYNYNIRTEYTYNSEGNVVQLLITDLSSGGTSITEKRTEFEYNEDQQLQHADYYAIMGNPSLFLISEADYTYENKKLSALTEYAYNYDGSVWNTSLETYRYNAGDDMTSKTVSFLIDDNWTYITCDSFVYNKPGTIVTEARYNWSEDNWYGFKKVDFKFDDAGNKIRQLVYFGNNNDWVPYYTYIYFYSANHYTFNQTAGKTSCIVYPNPTSGQLFTRLETSGSRMLALYSVEGQMLYNQQIKTGTTCIHYDFPNAGIYLLKIGEGNEQQIFKIVVRR